MSVDREPKHTCYLLNREAYGGLGKIYIDVLSDGCIQLYSNNVIGNPLSLKSQMVARKSYLAVISKEEDCDKLVLERSIFVENDDSIDPASNRPNIVDIEVAIMRGHNITGTRMDEKQLREIFTRVKDIYSKFPVLPRG